MWKTLRIMVLLTVLVTVALTAWLERTRSVSWSAPLWVGILPLAGDESPVTAAYVESLTAADFAPIGDFLRREARRHGRPGELVRMQLYPRVLAPLPARGSSEGPLANLWWSLQLRTYAWKRTREITGARPHIRLFVVYHDPARTVKVPHSVGLAKGLLGVVHGFASHEQNGGNQIVIAHELLHTLGASDKYDAAGLPVFPDGYADPGQQPLLPQRRAELMAGQRALSASKAAMPDSLVDVVIGDASAREIRWLQ